MPTDVLILGATALLAVVALVAAVVTVRAARVVARAATQQPAPAPSKSGNDGVEPVEDGGRSADDADVLLPVPFQAPSGPLSSNQARVVDGRVVIVPTEQQVVATALNRPATRLTVVVHGLAHALRPESRDRIAALMRRELTRRRRERSRAARRAAHAHVPTTPPGTSWVASDTKQAPGGRSS